MSLANKEFYRQGCQILFVPAHKIIGIMRNENAIPFDILNVEVGHHGNECSFYY
jgi:hypothetical protein